jgi:hypothetical protein
MESVKQNTAEKPKRPANNKQKKFAKKKRNTTSLPRPVTRINVHIKCAETQRLFHRHYEKTDVALLWIDTILDQVAQHEAMSEADTLIKERMKTCADDLQQRIDQMKLIREENGLDDIELTYKNQYKQGVEAQTPMAIKFYNLFKLMDQLMNEIDVLWFYEVIERNQRKDAANKSRIAISEVSIAIINFNTRAQSLLKKQKSEVMEAKANKKPTTNLKEVPIAAKENPKAVQLEENEVSKISVAV